MELDDREWMTAEEAARLLAVSVETVETLAVQRILRSFHDGNTLYVEPAVVTVHGTPRTA